MCSRTCHEKQKSLALWTLLAPDCVSKTHKDHYQSFLALRLDCSQPSFPRIFAQSLNARRESRETGCKRKTGHLAEEGMGTLLKSKEAVNSLLSPVLQEVFIWQSFPQFCNRQSFHRAHVTAFGSLRAILWLVTARRFAWAWHSDKYFDIYCSEFYATDWSSDLTDSFWKKRFPCIKPYLSLIFFLLDVYFLVILQINQFFMPSGRVVEWTNSSMCRVTPALLSSIFSSKITSNNYWLICHFPFSFRTQKYAAN